ncbi:Zn-ribbon domain-containing OB-fold protein [Nocardia iowensis]|uniref:OB-fold domain-containing protein n=1 Tax=Nocardia iowensis TaxID=204891 RepID=A0ABX8RXY9_NOCIO|nr:OB-fold domain-containing protein [Nocardia iowensis]QXN94544.1 OB-fold domain-containing protein [Nocardia iowensis]
MTVEPIDPHIMEWHEGRPRLLGCRCRTCAETNFPAQDSCRRCGGAEVAVVPLAEHGTLWSWTIQRFAPPSPPYVPQAEPFEPFGIGYVELPGEVIVETLLTEADATALRIGMPMRLTVLEVPTHCGAQAATFAFAPVIEGER